MAASAPPPPSPVPPELPVTADRPAIQPIRKRRPFGVRLWLGLMFSAIGILTGATVYIVVAGSSEGAAESRTADLAVGRTLRVREKVEPQLPTGRMTKANAPVDVLRETRPSEDFRTWLYNNPPTGPPKLVSPETVAGLSIATVRGRADAVCDRARRRPLRQLRPAREPDDGRGPARRRQGASRASCCRSPSGPRRSSRPCRRSPASA